MISIVNGYVCTSSCEAAAAKHGKDPHAPAGAPPGDAHKGDKASPFDGQPATVLDGALKGAASAAGVTATSDAAPPSRTSVNLLA